MAADVAVDAASTTIATGRVVSARAGRVRLPHEPALDGLRGLAVAVVVLFHLDRLEGGFLGVDLFFVLSGFLITSLLVTEHRGSGLVDLGRFWARRARRLLPALLLMMVSVSVVMFRLTPESLRVTFRGQALATLGYVANWQRMVDNVGYWEMFSAPSPLDHTWSLAIEEQFYLVWPLVALFVMGRRARESSRTRALGVLALGGAVLSFVLLWITYSPFDTNRAYFATDTRLGPTLLGAAMACWVVPARSGVRREGRPSQRVELAALVALGFMAFSVFTVDGLRSWYYRGGLLLFAAAALLVVHTVTGGPPGRLARALSWRPLCVLGMISYGVYLWHWPVIVYVTAARSPFDGVALDVFRVVVTLALAGASYVWVEAPIRHGALRGQRRRLTTLTAGAVAVTLVAVVIATSGTPAASDLDRPRELAGTDTDPLYVPAEVPDGTPKLLFVGDSSAWSSGRAFVAEGEERGVAVAYSSQIICTVVRAGDRVKMTNGAVGERPECPGDSRRDLYRDLVDQFDPDVVFYYVANAGGLGRERLDGEWVWDCDAAYDEFLQEALAEDVEVLAANGARVAIATSPYTTIALNEAASSRRRVDCRNDTYRAVAASQPDAEIVDLNAFVANEQASGDVQMLSDGLHLSNEGSRLAAAWIFGELNPEIETEKPA